MAARGVEYRDEIESNESCARCCDPVFPDGMGVMSYFPPRFFLDLLSAEPDLRALYETRAQIWERDGEVKILEHTENVLQVLQKYPIAEYLAGDGTLLTPRLFTLILTVHDLGKHLPEGYTGLLKGTRKKEDQHSRTLEIIRAIHPVLEISDSELALMEAIIGNDEMGAFIRAASGNRKPPIDEEKRQKEDFTPDGSPVPAKRDIEAAYRRNAISIEDYSKLIDGWEEFIAAADLSPGHIRNSALPLAESIRNDAATLGIEPARLLKYRTLYFQCDIRAYTADAITASPSLDYLLYRNPSAQSYEDPLFIFMPDEGRFLFSNTLEEAYRVLEAEVTGTGPLDPPGVFCPQCGKNRA